MKQPFRAIIPLLFSVALLLSLTTTASAAFSDFTDVKGHWAEGTLHQAYDDGILKGYDGLLNEEIIDMTAKDVSDSKTVNVRVSSDDCLEYVTGTEEITINPATLTVKTEGAKRAYNGKPLTAEGTITGFVNGETAKFTVTGSQTTVGQSKNTYNIDWKAKDTTAKKGNYTISENLGDLVVISKSIVPDDKNTPEEKKTGITVNEPSDSKYDGKEHKEVLTVTDTKTGKELVAEQITQ